FFILRIEHLRLFAPKGQRVDALFTSVAGLDDKASVRVAGVRVGRVDGIRLVDRKADVTLLIETPVALTRGTTASISNLGLLGDKYVELKLGPADAPPLAKGETIPGTTPVTIDEAMAKLDKIGDSFSEITGSITGKGQPTSLSRLIDNLEGASEQIRELVAANRAEVSSTIHHFDQLSGTLARELPKLTTQMERVLDQVDTVIAENRENLKGSMENIHDLTDSLRVSVANLNQITGKIASGQGTIGKLVESDQAHKSLISTLDSIKGGVTDLTDALNQAKKLKFHLGFNSYYLDHPGKTRTAFSINIDPQTDRFYYIGAVDDPRGRVYTKTDVITTTDPQGHTSTTTVSKVTTEDKMAISAQFGFRFARADFRAGLIESRGGAAIDVPTLDKHLWFTLEAFDFGRTGNLRPHLRFLSKWYINPHLYLQGGYDDFLVRDQRSIFIGAGIRWDDDELKYLLGSMPMRY
ncbi:MAG TPA: MlaD family protein, partial [Thermoanaerobaculia bacterium]|nr:MlaD family protein [Thermoanaerobaculia bacterium]